MDHDRAGLSYSQALLHTGVPSLKLCFCGTSFPLLMPFQAQGNASEQAMLQQQLDPLMRVAKAHSKGPEEYARSIVQEVLSQFADVEEMFQTSSGVTTEQVGPCLHS